jgi:dinuclear metal center YbgI/SA1388 family protein
VTSPSLRLGEVLDVLDALYDPRDAQAWDSVGLVSGDRDQPVQRILFAVDPVQEVIDEAADWSADLLVTHHPLLLRGVHSVAADHPKGRAVTALVRAGIALHVAHTNADVAEPGVSDAFADALGLVDLRPLEPLAQQALVKVVTFVPRADAQRVIDAMAAAGAGRLGDYERAAFLSDGTGTFRPLAGANPAVGSVGQVEELAETRVEMAVTQSKVPAVVLALRNAHPYEEPAHDLLAQIPVSGPKGLGRVGRLPDPMPLKAFAGQVAARLPRTEAGVRVAGDPDQQIASVAVVGGAGDDMFAQVRASGVDAYVTADLRHHPASEARGHGRPALVDCSHWATEWPWLDQAERLLRERLGASATTVETRISRIVTDPWSFRPDSDHPGSEH